MTFETATSFTSRAFFAAAFVLVLLAVAEFVSNLAGYTFLRNRWDASRFLEYAVVLLVFVIAMLLRQIRDGKAA